MAFGDESVGSSSPPPSQCALRLRIFAVRFEWTKRARLLSRQQHLFHRSRPIVHHFIDVHPIGTWRTNRCGQYHRRQQRPAHGQRCRTGSSLPGPVLPELFYVPGISRVAAPHGTLDRHARYRPLPTSHQWAARVRVHDVQQLQRRWPAHPKLQPDRHVLADRRGDLHRYDNHQRYQSLRAKGHSLQRRLHGRPET